MGYKGFYSKHPFILFILIFIIFHEFWALIGHLLEKQGTLHIIKKYVLIALLSLNLSPRSMPPLHSVFDVTLK